MGDAAGIGPEIIVKALAEPTVYEICNPVVLGDFKILKRAIRVTNSNVTLNKVASVQACKFKPFVIDCIDFDLLPENLPYGKISSVAGDAAFQFIKVAISLAKVNEIQGICTAPLNKEALHKGGHIYPGHTEILAELTNTEHYAMMLSSPKLKVVHLTTHVGLKRAIESITPDRTHKVIQLAHEALDRAGFTNPRIAVCGINPHAGENGLFGEGEEEKKLIPGINKARSIGINVSGPYPADTLFFKAVRGDFDVVIACYHDQGHIPVKVLGMDEGVNVTVGLRKGIIRTSVDHGTAFDIAGKNIANARSMLAAIQMAAEMSPRN